MRRALALALVVAAALCLTACGPPGPRALHKGDRLVESGNFDEAVGVLSQAVNQLSNDPPARAQACNLLGLAYHGGGKPDKARPCYEEALRLKRDLAAADFNWGCLELEQTNLSKAVDLLTTYTALQKLNVDGFLKLGEAHFRLAMQSAGGSERTRQLTNARKDFESAQNLVKTTEAGNNLGVIELLLSPNPSRALITNAAVRFQVALARDPQYSAAMLNLAIVQDKYLNDGHLALKTYGQYLALNPPPSLSNEVAKVMTNLDRSLRFQAVPGRSETPALTPPDTTPGRITVIPGTPPRPPPTPAGVESNLPRPLVVPGPAVSPSNTTPPSTPAPPVTTPPTAIAPAATAPPAATRSEEPPPPSPAPEPKPAPGGNLLVGGTTAPAGTGVPPPSEPAAGRSLLSRINPLNWFGGRASPAPTSDSTPAGGSARPASGTPIVTPLPEPPPLTPPPPRPAAAHYLPPPVAMYEGNRETAERLRAQGAAAEKESRWKDALANYQDAIKADPRDYEACLALGLAAIKSEQFDLALDALHHAVTLNPDSGDARYAYAWALEKKEFFQDASNELEKMLAQHPNEARAHLLLGNLYARQLGQPDLAREHYKKVLETDPHNPQATAIRFWLQGNPGN
jgi:tetratricopeptide (TPR) repeat protein